MTNRYELRCKFQLPSRVPLVLEDVTPSGNDLKFANRAFVRLAEFCRSGSDLLRVELWDHERGGLMRWVDVSDEQIVRLPARRRLLS
jgi:hypothetical protein